MAYAWYGEGTRFLDISNPRQPKQIAYWRPDDTLVWASYMHDGYVYTADHVRGIDVLPGDVRRRCGAERHARGRREAAVSEAATLPGSACLELPSGSRHARVLPADPVATV